MNGLRKAAGAIPQDHATLGPLAPNPPGLAQALDIGGQRLAIYGIECRQRTQPGTGIHVAGLRRDGPRMDAR